MKLNIILSASLTLLAAKASAWPIMVLREMNERGINAEDAMKAILPDYAKRQDVGLPAVLPFPDNFGIPRKYIFDAKEQYLDLTGEHEWQAPGPDDRRGPCAGLNALANHVSRGGGKSIFPLIILTCPSFFLFYRASSAVTVLLTEMTLLTEFQKQWV